MFCTSDKEFKVEIILGGFFKVLAGIPLGPKIYLGVSCQLRNWALEYLQSNAEFSNLKKQNKAVSSIDLACNLIIAGHN